MLPVACSVLFSGGLPLFSVSASSTAIPRDTASLTRRQHKTTSASLCSAVLATAAVPRRRRTRLWAACGQSRSGVSQIPLDSQRRALLSGSVASCVGTLVGSSQGPRDAVAAGNAGFRSAPAAVRALWASGLTVENVNDWQAAFAEDCIYEDLYFAEPAVGRAAVATLLKEKPLPKGSTLVVDRISDGKLSCGFTWHVEERGVGTGLRGLTFVELNPEGQVSFVREVSEPLFKAGVLTEKLLEALTKDQPPSPTKANTLATPIETPTAAGDIVRYLYGPVQQSGGDAVRFYAEDVIYEDMNYEVPFVGKPAVAEFLGRFQVIQGVTFKLERVSDGQQAVGFTYTIQVAGQPRGIRGATFYEVDKAGKVCYVRDVPESAAKPPPLQFLARALRPGLRTLRPSAPLPGDVAGTDPLLQA